MLIAGVVLGLVLGLLVGGSVWHLARVRLHWLPILLLAVLLRFGTELAIAAGIGLADTLRLPLYALAYGLLLAGLWANRYQPGLNVAFVGILLNMTAVVVNGGRMPIWEPSLAAAGLTVNDIRSTFHSILPATIDASFLLRAGPLVDVIPIPFPLVRNVASIGDVFLALGLAFFLFATVVRSPHDLFEEEEAAVRMRLTGVATAADERREALRRAGAEGRPRLGLAHSLAEAATLERPVVLGGSLPGLSPGQAPSDSGPDVGGAAALPADQLPTVERVRRHPYIRLALNPSFSALWAGQLVSLLGDRIHQIALAFLVLAVTDSPIALGAVFVAATLPNLLFSPVAGALVDRWELQEVLVVSDLLRAALVLLVPIAAVINIVLVFPLVFAITTVSIFFRPARVAILPRLVRDDELLTANSATWISETLADVVGYPLAGLFVAFLGDSLPLAFWIDAATYLASAVLLWSIVVRSGRRTGPSDEAKPGLIAEMKEGWRFLRGEATLLANTLQATVGQFTIGILIALTPLYARDVIEGGAVDPEATYAFLEASIGVGNLLGGFAIGLVGAALARGRLVISGYAAWGLCTALLGLTGNLGIALGLTFGSGIANMVFVIPSQTLFQERTPAALMGRVLGFRFGLVFGSMTIAMAVGGILAEVFGPAAVIAVFGGLTMVAGLAGLFVPAVRDA